jgi:predicted transcriptional regulator
MVVSMSSVNGESSGRRRHLFRGRRVTVRDLVNANLLKPGTILVYDRPQVGETYQVTVTESGRLRLPDGRETASLSGAVRELSGKSVDGWYAWRMADTDVSLHALRQRLLEEATWALLDGGHSDLEAREAARQEEFLQSAKKDAEVGVPRRMSVRELIGIWGARGRDFGLNEKVYADLINRGMTTEPDFRAVTLDDAVAIVLTTQVATDEAQAVPTDDGSAYPEASPQVEAVVNDDEGAWDHGLTIGNLPSASKEVCSITPDATFDKAIALMLIEDFSQLAVMTGPRDLKGAVSWKSIAKARNANPDTTLAAAIVKAEAVPYTADLIDVLPVIQRQEFVFVRGVDGSVTGIVTVADVVDVYGQMASPFFMLGRIDQSLRRIIEATFPMKTIIPLCDPDGLRDLSSYDQFTMGDYQRILENPDCWLNLGWPLHRKTFCARLEKIGKVRNNIMHFNNDPLPDDVLSMLQNFIDLLKDYGNQQ